MVVDSSVVALEITVAIGLAAAAVQKKWKKRKKKKDSSKERHGFPDSVRRE